jgi:hypothetical protein
MVFSLWLWQTTKLMITKNTHQMLEILIAKRIRRCNGGTSPDEAHLWLHVKPLDATIGQVPRRIAPAAAMVDNFEKKKTLTKHNFYLVFAW